MKKKSNTKKMKIIMSSFIIMIFGVYILAFLEISSAESTSLVNPITEENYKEWSSSNLEEAAESAMNFYIDNYGNNVWTKGSLQALLTVTGIAQKTNPESIEADLIREQLIQTVQKLEKRVLGQSDTIGELIFDNNYPVKGLDYNLNYKINDKGIGESKEIKYDIVFLLDWSGSMNGSISSSWQKIPNSRLHARDMILGMARKILQETGTGTRVRILGVNTQKNNVIGDPGNTDRPYWQRTIQIGSDYFDKNSNYEEIISNIFLPNPEFPNDNIPLSIDEATELMLDYVRKGAIPHLFVFSDFELKVTNDVTGEYIEALNRYKNKLREASGELPIYHAVNYRHTYNKSFPMNSDPIFSTPGWGYSEVNSSNFPNAVNDFTSLIEAQLSYKNWEAVIESPTFPYIDNTFHSSVTDKIVANYNPILLFGGSRIGEGKGGYSVRYNSTNENQNKKGDLIPFYRTSTIVQPETGEIYKFSQNPQLFAPITDLAIELLEYKGQGNITDTTNYISLKGIVSKNFKAYGGTQYALVTPKLASIEYGQKMTKEEVLSILKEMIGNEEYNLYDFSDENNPTQQYLTASFDSSKNVYKIYSTVKNEVSMHQQNISNEIGKNFIGDDIQTTILGTVESQFGLKDGKLTVSIPKEYNKPKKLWINNNVVQSIDKYYSKDAETGEQNIELSDLILSRKDTIQLKYISEINDSNDNNLLTTKTEFSGSNRANLFSSVTDQANVGINEQPIVRVKYLDQNGNQMKSDKNKLIEDKIVEGKVGNNFDVSSSEFNLKIKGYELDPEQLATNQTGVFQKKAIVVKYVYRKINKAHQTRGSYQNQLSFTWAPKSFSLGSRRALLLNNVFEIDCKEKQWLVVNEGRDKEDERFGNSWQVNARMDPLKSSEGEIIKGAQFYFDVSDVKNYHIGDQINALKTDIVPQNPNESNVITDFDEKPDYIDLGGEIIDNNKKVIKLLGSGEEITIMQQTENLPDGKNSGYAIQLENKRLIVPKVRSKDYNKQFHSTIIWTLSRDISY